MIPGARDIDKQLRLESKDLASRLASIRHDAAFVNSVADAFYPLSLRFPDALAKTVPIWCAVLNTASHNRYGVPEIVPELCTPSSVSPSEHAQIASRVTGWADELLRSDLQVPRLGRPLCPVFVHPPDIPHVHLGTSQHSVVLLCASATQGPSLSPLTYVQGAGDDHENWAQGLTPELYWRHEREFAAIANDRAVLEDRVHEIVAQAKTTHMQLEWFSVAAASGDTHVCDTPLDLAVCAPGSIPATKGYYVLCVYCSQGTVAPGVLCLNISSGKKGLAEFSERLHTAVDTITAVLDKHPHGKVLLACSDGHLSGALAVALLAASFDDTRQLTGPASRAEHRKSITKDTTKRRLQWVVGSGGTAPSRALLQRVNSFLIGPQRAYR
ncbi:tRNA A64-2'-O-ribosylphosphate transferase [Malassezia cuniculi]|uniref:tRNA A64-2'-O-ribosylphosphate transferase n=1 Tax=Malassezia cuniculi TaxID=948313 RepID=A0AAF0J5E5_9BASI|nr:tRNA A64-2'-O-ribosylphosphate transferase [Malassezia cuniculi]